jgi:hypothetical protein
MITFRRIGLCTCLIASVLFLWFAFQMCILVIDDMRMRTTESLSGGSRAMIASEPTLRHVALEAAYRVSPGLRAYVGIMDELMAQSANEGKLSGSAQVLREACAYGDQQCRRLQDIVDWLLIDDNQGLAKAYISFTWKGVSSEVVIYEWHDSNPNNRKPTTWKRVNLVWSFGN